MLANGGVARVVQPYEREQVIFQLGDFHYTEFSQATTDVDTHDKATPGALESTLGLPVPRAISRAIVDQLNAAPGAIIAVCGDITTRGNRGGFVDGIRFLNKILSDPRLTARPPVARLHIVPGNHDVNFTGDQPFVSFEDVSRFDALGQICIDEGLGDVLATTHRESTVRLPSGGGVSIISVNTCRGAGASRRNLPSGAKDHVLEAALAEAGSIDLDDAITAHSPEVELAEVLDVPLLHPYEIEAIAKEWGALDHGVFPILLAHHGLLPQHTPRLNPYTEMANAGQARRELRKLARPVLYLHGHIHEHVVEIVDFPKSSDISPMHDRAVIVAAPELKHGFNKIVVSFSAQGRPLGLRIQKYRISSGEQTVSLEPDVVEVTLAPRPALTARHRALLSYAVESGAATGAELVAHGRDLTPPMVDEEIESVVEILCWAGVMRKNSPDGTKFSEAGFLI
jgi:hypothetical protein